MRLSQVPTCQKWPALPAHLFPSIIDL
jgi:hypothetical protein